MVGRPASRALLVCGAAAFAGTGPAHAARPGGPGYAAELARSGSTGELWRAESVSAALAGVAAASPDQRQRARWTYARSLIVQRRAAEAAGVLATMLQDEPDLGLVAPFQLATGRVLVELGRGAEAVAALGRTGLTQVPEACAWRLRALVLAGAAQLAMSQVACASPAIAARPPIQREAFLLAGATAAIESGQPQLAVRWSRYVSPASAAGSLVRGRAYLAAGKAAAAAGEFRSVSDRGTSPERAEAALGAIEAALLARHLPPTRALPQLQLLAYRWRGGEVERRALLLSFDLARIVQDDQAAIRAAATLVRYHQLGSRLAPLLHQARAMLFAATAPGSRLPLDRAAGLYWDHRDLAAAGVEGDLLALQLADRLQEAGLYARAADLLEHQLTVRTRDVAQGPLSVRVAKLHILSGRPQRALDAIKLSSVTAYPRAMHHDRQQVEAVALQLLGRGREALAVLQGVPGSGALQAELLWKQRSWAAFADLVGRNLPGPGALSEVRQALVLRQAITLGMLGREAQLAKLRVRYADAFAALPTAGAFDLLTRPAGQIDAELLTGAMASLPAVSPVGDYGDLLDAAPEPRDRTQRR